jgi:CheY-like chemotaxis protein
VPLTQPPQSSNSAGLPSKYILIGEDDVDDVDMLQEVFASVDESFSLVFLHSGQKIIDALENSPVEHLPCLIVLDYNMPELNGAEILRYLSNSPRFKSIPKVIWSTSNSSIYRTLCLELGANDYVTKPSSLQEFVQVARHTLSFC